MNKYLVELKEEKEKEAIRRIFLPFHLQSLMGYMGFSFGAAFLLIFELRKSRLTNAISDISDNSGDIDVLVGRIPPLHQKQTWPPHIDQFTALEAKCAYWSLAEDKLKSTKSSDTKQLKIQEQIEDLVDMGFHQVGLLDVIANTVFTGSWAESGFSASSSLRRAEEEYLSGRLRENSLAGHIACSIGAIEGKTEQFAGATCSRLLKPFGIIPQMEDISERKKHIRSNLSKIVSSLPEHKGSQFAYVDCRNCNELKRIVPLLPPPNSNGEALFSGYGCEQCLE